MKCERCDDGYAPIILGLTRGRFYNHMHFQLEGECPFCKGSGELPDNIDQWPDLIEGCT